ncbi:sterol desaturase family protein [Shimia haliotis]|uniref:Sterol desaturase/sphingolipid hydroxylase, fatty acid hydroxylase superfamily n=1 Tax=Shimia haliotis TaxID=1280847 RepID=A0A1I4CSA4_9RHOB|nr:sterol desaturase family protein [Shimia haliotis]SFK83673.1 Sterol desaturase/sphingolipid hydroxylase, fatty acid hydroxylase superfamily [Shimia haliotis]
MQDFIASYLDYVRHFFSAIFDPTQRIYLLYLASSIIFAFGVYLAARKAKKSEAGSFLSFLFPKSVWGHPSAWLDVRYFFFHKLIGHFLLFGVLAAAMAFVFKWITGTHLTQLEPTVRGHVGLGIVLLYMFVTVLVSDFIGYAVHYLQHKVPILWEFHKVHHSAEVMHPLSNYREHPIDNLFYLFAIGVGYGVVTGVTYNLLGVLPNDITIIGVPVLLFLFNIFAYNLRHSHIWLRWPGNWSKIFPSPAHHHVHHSCHPEHCDKNFAFMFPMWDVIFGTYTMPEDNRDVKFGVLGMKSMEMDSVWKLYGMPFAKAGRRLKKGWERKKPRTPAE